MKSYTVYSQNEKEARNIVYIWAKKIKQKHGL